MFRLSFGPYLPATIALAGGISIEYITTKAYLEQKKRMGDDVYLLSRSDRPWGAGWGFMVALLLWPG
jgi:hypothetical protein